MKIFLFTRWLNTLATQTTSLFNFLFKEDEADRLPTNDKGHSHINWSGIETSNL